MKGINFYILGLVLIILYCAYTVTIYVFFSGGNFFYLGFLGIVVFFSYFIFYKPQPCHFKMGLFIFLISIAGIVISHSSNVSQAIVMSAVMLPVLSFFLLEKKDANIVLSGINDILAVLVFLSLILYLVDIWGTMLPKVGLSHFLQYYYRNYFNLYIDVVRYDGRFCGFTLEPGYFSLLLVSLLLVCRYDLNKKCTYFYLGALICTLSLGGYLLGAIGFLLQRTLVANRIGKEMLAFLLVVLSFCIFVVFALKYNEGNNIIVEKIFSRLLFDEDVLFVGNNRENELARQVIDNYFYSPKVLWGIGNEKVNELLSIKGLDACSWRVFVIEYGAIYTIIFFSMSLWVLLKTDVRITLPFFVVYWLDFYQHGALYSETYYLLFLYLRANMKSISSKEYYNRVNIVMKPLYGN